MADPISLFAALTFLLAGLVKGVIGLGLPTVAMGLLVVAMPPADAAALLIVPSLVTNVWQMLAGGHLARIAHRLWSMMLGVWVGTLAGGGLITSASTHLAAAALGAALALYAALGLLSLRWTVRGGAERWLSPVIGAVTGLITAATGVFVIPAVPYLQAIGLDKEELVQALGLSFTVSTLALAATLAHAQAFPASLAAASLLALLPAVLGMVAGQWARARLREDTFRRVFFAGLLALGTYLMVRALR
jgi:uncharacterized membrane protein YfcA